MKEQDFRADLPTMTVCDRCGACLIRIAWTIAPLSSYEFYGIGIVKCEPCSWVRVAAAGSSDYAHKYASAVRRKLVNFINT